MPVILNQFTRVRHWLLKGFKYDMVIKVPMVEAWYSPIKEELAAVEKEIVEVVHSDNAELDEMCNYVITSGGKRVRPAICILSYLACGGKEPQKAVRMGSAFEIVHSASLVHDDINDKSEIRRGRKTLHKEYCVSKAIVAGDYMMAKGFQALGATSREIVDVIVEAASRMSEGEFVQKDFEHAKDVTEEDYYEIIKGKTAKLIEACAKSGAYISGADAEFIEAVGKFALSIGMAFQIIDDTLDVIGDLNNTGKKVGLDILEGKPTLPTIFAMKDSQYGKRIIEIFTEDEVAEKDAAEAIELIKKTNAIELCRKRAEGMIDDALTYLGPIPESVYKDSLIGLANYIVSRDR